MKYLTIEDSYGKRIRIELEKKSKRYFRPGELRGLFIVKGKHRNAWGNLPQLHLQHTASEFFMNAYKFRGNDGKNYVSFGIFGEGWLAGTSWEVK